MIYATFNIVSAISHTCAIGRGYRRLMFFDTFNNVSVVYHTCAAVRAFRRLMFYATFNIQSFTTPVLQSRHSESSCFMPLSIFSHLPHLCCSQGVEWVRVSCHFQYCFNHSPHLCYRQGGSGGSCFMPLSIMFQSFTPLLLQARGLRRLMFVDTFNNISVIYHSFAVGSGAQEVHVYCHSQ